MEPPNRTWHKIRVLFVSASRFTNLQSRRRTLSQGATCQRPADANAALARTFSLPTLLSNVLPVQSGEEMFFEVRYVWGQG